MTVLCMIHKPFLDFRYYIRSQDAPTDEVGQITKATNPLSSFSLVCLHLVLASRYAFNLHLAPMTSIAFDFRLIHSFSRYTTVGEIIEAIVKYILLHYVVLT